MKDGRTYLRRRFESQTDIVIHSRSTSWKKYAIWLEALQVESIKKKLIKENNILRNNIHHAIDILEKAITARIAE